MPRVGLVFEAFPFFFKDFRLQVVILGMSGGGIQLEVERHPVRRFDRLNEPTGESILLVGFVGEGYLMSANSYRRE